MESHAKKCVGKILRTCERKRLNSYTKSQLHVFDEHQFKEEEIGSVGESSNGCLQNVLKCLNLARIGRPGILWSVNKLARAITKWTRACDKRFCTFGLLHSSEFKQYCHVEKLNINVNWDYFKTLILPVT